MVGDDVGYQCPGESLRALVRILGQERVERTTRPAVSNGGRCSRGIPGRRAAAGRLTGRDGTNGGADGTDADGAGGVNGDTGAGAADGGVNGGTGGGGVNSGKLPAGDGGVAVAITGPRSIGCSRPVRGAGGTSLARGGGGASR